MLSPSPRLRPPRRYRFGLLVIVTLAGLATMPTQGADGHLERPKPRIQMAGAERWRLRPTEVVPIATGSLARRSETAIPEERRSVRLVYPALVEAR